MAINLQKGQRENLKAPKFTIGLGWDTNRSASGYDFDLDASVFMLGEDKRLIADDLEVSVQKVKLNFVRKENIDCDRHNFISTYTNVIEVTVDNTIVVPKGFSA